MDIPPIAESSPSPKPSLVTRFVSSMSKSFHEAARRASGINDKLAHIFHISTRWVSGFEIAATLTAGFTMIQVGEYTVTALLWVVLACVLIAKTLDSNLGAIRKTLLVGLSIFSSLLLITWTNIKRGDGDWSALSAPIHRLLYVSKAGGLAAYRPAPPLPPPFWAARAAPSGLSLPSPIDGLEQLGWTITPATAT